MTGTVPGRPRHGSRRGEDADVLAAEPFSDKVAWFENVGFGVFGPERIVTDADDGAYRVVTADLSDGRPDVLTASLNDDRVRWFENFLSPPDATGTACPTSRTS